MEGLNIDKNARDKLTEVPEESQASHPWKMGHGFINAYEIEIAGLTKSQKYTNSIW
jgi:hypothetical protein